MTGSLFHGATSDGVHVGIRPDRIMDRVVMMTGLIYRFNLRVLPAEALGIRVWRLSAVSRRWHEGRRGCETRRIRGEGRRARRRSWVGTVRRGIGGVVRVNVNVRGRVRIVILDRVVIQRDTICVHLAGLPGSMRGRALGGHGIRGGGLLGSGATYRSGLADERAGRWR